LSARKHRSYFVTDRKQVGGAAIDFEKRQKKSQTRLGPDKTISSGSGRQERPRGTTPTGSRQKGLSACRTRPCAAITGRNRQRECATPGESCAASQKTATIIADRMNKSKRASCRAAPMGGLRAPWDEVPQRSGSNTLLQQITESLMGATLTSRCGRVIGLHIIPS